MVQRIAVYYVPRDAALALQGSTWLGWDVISGRETAPPELTGLPLPAKTLTAIPRRYGFHGTLRAPFRPAEDCTPPRIDSCIDALAARLARVSMETLEVQVVQDFLALVPQGNPEPLQRLAAEVVRATNPLRAPSTPDEIARRHPDRLTPRQRTQLEAWGYPYVMDDFQFHITLTGPLAPESAKMAQPILQAHFDPFLPKPFVIEDLCLLEEDGKGRFHLLNRYALRG
jgi:hypothetical protein